MVSLWAACLLGDMARTPEQAQRKEPCSKGPGALSSTWSSSYTHPLVLPSVTPTWTPKLCIQVAQHMSNERNKQYCIISVIVV